MCNWIQGQHEVQELVELSGLETTDRKEETDLAGAFYCKLSSCSLRHHTLELSHAKLKQLLANLWHGR